VEMPLESLVPTERPRYQLALGGLLHLVGELVVVVGRRADRSGRVINASPSDRASGPAAALLSRADGEPIQVDTP
jgi:hypothetical protein